MMQSNQIETHPAPAATASRATRSARNRSAVPISRRRSARSTTAPAGSESNNHGSVMNTLTAATAIGFWVIRAASSGRAA